MDLNIRSTPIRRAALYARVSTVPKTGDPAVDAEKQRKKQQEVANQLLELRDYCKNSGWPITKEYVDHASAKSSGVNTPSHQ